MPTRKIHVDDGGDEDDEKHHQWLQSGILARGKSDMRGRTAGQSHKRLLRLLSRESAWNAVYVSSEAFSIFSIDYWLPFAPQAP
jgi:hypothetical protein